MDAANNPLAQHFDEMVKKAEREQKSLAIERMYEAIENTDLAKSQAGNQPPAANGEDTARFSSAVITPGQPKADNTFLKEQAETTDEQELLEKIKANKKQVDLQASMMRPHHKTIKTPEELAAEEAARKEVEKAQKLQQAQAVTPPKNPGIVNLANTNDLSVASIASLANRKLKNNNTEGVIKLH
jgi:thiol:disulfide interchange protein